MKDVHSGITDLQVVSWAKTERRIIISNDKDFIGLSAKYPEVDMILFDYIEQNSNVRIAGLKQVLPKVKQGFGIAILQ